MGIKVVGRWRVELPRHVTRANELIKRHWRHGWLLGRKDKKMVAEQCFLARVPDAAGKRRVGLHVVLGPRQRADPDCFWKVLLDALKACKAIRSDDRKWCELGTPTFERGPKAAMVVELTDLEDE
jgi:hypothetical protein